MKKLNLENGTKEQAAPYQHTKTSLRWVLLIPVILLIGLLAALYRNGEHINLKAEHKVTTTNKETTTAATTTTTHNEESSKRKIRNNIKAYVKAESSTYQYSRLGGISNLKISVINTSHYLMDKVRVKINYIKSNGGIWDTRYEEFNAVQPQTTLTHKIPDTKRGTSVEYEIVSIKSKAIGLQ